MLLKYIGNVSYDEYPLTGVKALWQPGEVQDVTGDRLTLLRSSVLFATNSNFGFVGNGSTISGVSPGFYSSDTTEKVLCDFLGNFHPSLWSKLVDANGIIAIATPDEIPGGVSFKNGPVVKLLSNNAGGCNFVSPTFVAKNIGTNGSFTNIRVPIFFPDCSRSADNSLYDSIVIDFGTLADLTSRVTINLAAPSNSTAQPSGSIVQNDSLRGWHDFIIPVSNIAAPAVTNVATHSYSGTPDLASIVKIRIQFKKFDAASNDPIFIGPITYGSKGATKIAFSFDDDDISIYNTAFPALEKRGFKGCFFTKGSVQTNSGVTKVNLAQLQELKTAGWTIANHTQNHHNHLLEDMTYQERIDDIATHMQWLKSYGFDWDIFAWPGGACHKTSKDILKLLGVKAAFNYSSPDIGRLINIHDTAYIGDRYFLNRTANEGSTTQTLTNSENYINHAIATGGHIVLSGHVVGAAATGPTNILLSEFETVLDRILELQRAGLVNVVSVRELVDSGYYSDY